MCLVLDISKGNALHKQLPWASLTHRYDICNVIFLLLCGKIIAETDTTLLSPPFEPQAVKQHYAFWLEVILLRIFGTKCLARAESFIKLSYD